MKPTLLEAYEKGRRIINSMTPKTIGACRRYITLFSRMFIYSNPDLESSENARRYREDLIDRHTYKMFELGKNIGPGEDEVLNNAIELALKNWESNQHWFREDNGSVTVPDVIKACVTFGWNCKKEYDNKK